MTQVRSQELGAVVTACPQLERLVVAHCGLTGEWLPQLTRCPQLRELDLSWSRVRSQELAAVVAACPQLERLAVADCRELTGDWLPQLTRCPQLRQLNLSETQVRSQELGAVVAACPQLERLVVARCGELTGDWLPQLTRCPQLRQLNLSETQVRSQKLGAVVAACPRLERLVVARCGELTGEWLPELARCPQLQELDITGLTRADPDLFGIPTACSRLERLRVAQMRNPLLTFPTVSLPGLTHLDLRYTGTDDTTFRRLPDLLPGLRDLGINGCRLLTDSALASVLPRLTCLQTLDMEGTGSNPSGMLVSRLSGLPLKALSCDWHGERVVDLLRRCPTLTLLRPTGDFHYFATSIAANLAKDPIPAHRKIILVVLRRDQLVEMLPGNIRVLEDIVGRWGEFVD